MVKFFMLVLLLIPVAHGIPCTAKCYYKDRTATPCWDPYASSYSYQSETGNCLCCPNGTICSTCKTMTAAGPYYKGYETVTSTALSCMCTSDAPCQTSGNKCSTCDPASGNCIAGTVCSDGSCKKAGQECPAQPECTTAADCSAYMPTCAACENNLCNSYSCPIGNNEFLCAKDNDGRCRGDSMCDNDQECPQPPYNCTKCDAQRRCVSHSCPDGSCNRDVDGTGACPSSTTTSNSLTSSFLTSSIFQELSLTKALGIRPKEGGFLSVLGI